MAASVASASRPATLPCGVTVRVSICALVSPLRTWARGLLAERAISRRVPARIALRWSCSEVNTVMPTVPPSSTSAGNP